MGFTIYDLRFTRRGKRGNGGKRSTISSRMDVKWWASGQGAEFVRNFVLTPR